MRALVALAMLGLAAVARGDIALFGGMHDDELPDPWSFGHARVSATADGGALVTTTSNSWTSDWSPFNFTRYPAGWLLRLAPDGTVAWQRALSADQRWITDGSLCKGAVELGSGDILVVGELLRDPYDLYLARLGADGAFVDSRTSGDHWSYVEKRIERRTGGGALYIDHGRVRAFDASGALEWSRDYSPRPCAPQKSILESWAFSAPDGSLAFVGASDCLLAPTSLFVVRHRSDGTVRWAVETPATVTPDTPHRPVVVDGTGQVIVASVDRLMVLDDAGVQVREVRLAVSGGGAVARDLGLLADGSLFWTGESMFGGLRRVLIVVLAPDLTVRHASFVGRGDDHARCHDADVGPDGRAWIAMSLGSPEDPDDRGGPYGFAREREIAIGTTDTAGVLTGPCDTVVPATVTTSDEPLRAWTAAPVATTASTGFTGPQRALIAQPTFAGRATPPCDACDSDRWEVDDACGSNAHYLRPGEAARPLDSCDGTEDWVPLLVAEGATYSVSARDVGADSSAVVDLIAGDCATLLAPGLPDATGTTASWTADVTGTVHARVRQSAGQWGPDTSHELTMTADDTPCRTWQLEMVDTGLVDQNRHATRFLQAAPRAVDAGGFVTIQNDCVVRLAESGAVQWRRCLDAAGVVDHAVLIDVLPGGGYVVAGRLIDPVGGFYVADLDADGGIVQAERIEAQVASPYPSALVARADGSILLLTPENRLLIRDPAGAWTAHVPDAGHFVSRLLPVPGGAMLLGSREMAPTGWDPMAALWSDAGGVAWSSVVHLTTTSPSLDASTFNGGVVRPDGSSLLVTGAMAPVVLSASGDVLSAKLPPDRWSATVEAVSAPGGGLLVSQGGYRLARLDATGDVLWSQSLAESSHARMGLTVDGDVVLAGRLAGAGADFVARIPVDEPAPLTCAAAEVIALSMTPTPAMSEPSELILTPSPVLASPIAMTTFDPPGVVVAVETCTCPPSGPAPPPMISGHGSSRPLVFLGPTTLAWAPAAGSGATSFNVYRGAIAALPSGGAMACLATGLTVPTLEVPELPEPGSGGSTYLVSGSSARGEGPLGESSAGDPIVASSPCP